MSISLWIAYYLNKKIKGITFFRILFYLPSVVPVVASSLLFIHLLAPTEGLINQALAIFGIQGPAWLLDPNWVKPALILMSLWGVGGSVVLLLAGMKGIPQEPARGRCHRWGEKYTIVLPYYIPNADSRHFLQSRDWYDRSAPDLRAGIHRNCRGT